MVRILVEFSFFNENVEEAKELIDELVNESLKEEGCVYYSGNQVSGDENTFILYEVFKDKDAQEFHRTTKHYEEVLKGKLTPLIKERKVRFLI